MEEQGYSVSPLRDMRKWKAGILSNKDNDFYFANSGVLRRPLNMNDKTVEKAVQKQQSEVMTQTLESVDYFNRLAKILRWFCANCPVWSVFKKQDSNEFFHRGVSNMLLKQSYETKDPQQKVEIYQQFIDFYRGK